MGIDQNLLNRFKKYDLTDSEKLLWIDFFLKETDPDGFFFFRCQDWLHTANHSRRTLYRRLRNLENQHLIIRKLISQTLESCYVTDGAGGKFSFIKVLLPETEQDMSFFGKLHLIESKTFPSKEVHRTAIFRDVYNLADDIRFQYAFCELEENDANSRSLRELDIGQSVVFQGCVKRNTEGRPWIVNIWNIRPAEEFYADGRN